MFLDIMLIIISAIIAFTDNVMMKNEVNKIEDYSRLSLLKDKIKKYTLLNERDIEQNVLWERYMPYAVSFGITEKIHDRLVNLNLDNELVQILNSAEFNSFIVSEYCEFYRNNSNK